MEERTGIEEMMKTSISTDDGEANSLPGIVRKARFSDLEAIMDINRDVHEGLDYFPAMFHHFMHSKLHSLYIYEEDGKAVGTQRPRQTVYWLLYRSLCIGEKFDENGGPTESKP